MSKQASIPSGRVLIALLALAGMLTVLAFPATPVHADDDNLSVDDLTVTAPDVGDTGTLVVTFTASDGIPSGGSVFVSLPSSVIAGEGLIGLPLDGVPSSVAVDADNDGTFDMVDTLTSSVAGHTVTVSASADVAAGSDIKIVVGSYADDAEETDKIQTGYGRHQPVYGDVDVAIDLDGNATTTEDSVTATALVRVGGSYHTIPSVPGEADDLQLEFLSPRDIAAGSWVSFVLHQDFQLPDSLTADDILLEIEAPFLGEVADPPFDQNVHDARPAQVVVSSAALFGEDNQDHLIQVQLPDTYPDTDGEQGVIKDGYVILVISSDVGIKAPADTGSYQTGYALMKEPNAGDVEGLTALLVQDAADLSNVNDLALTAPAVGDTCALVLTFTASDGIPSGGSVFVSLPSSVIAGEGLIGLPLDGVLTSVAVDADNDGAFDMVDSLTSSVAGHTVTVSASADVAAGSAIKIVVGSEADVEESAQVQTGYGRHQPVYGDVDVAIDLDGSATTTEDRATATALVRVGGSYHTIPSVPGEADDLQLEFLSPRDLAAGSWVSFVLHQDFQLPDSLTADDILLEIEAPFLGEVADPPFDQNVHDAQPAQVVVSSAALFGDDNQDHLIQVQLPDTYPDTDGEQGVIKDGYVILVISSDVGIKAPADTGSYQTGYALMKEPTAGDVEGLTAILVQDAAELSNVDDLALTAPAVGDTGTLNITFTASDGIPSGGSVFVSLPSSVIAGEGLIGLPLDGVPSSVAVDADNDGTFDMVDSLTSSVAGHTVTVSASADVAAGSAIKIVVGSYADDAEETDKIQTGYGRHQPVYGDVDVAIDLDGNATTTEDSVTATALVRVGGSYHTIPSVPGEADDLQLEFLSPRDIAAGSWVSFVLHQDFQLPDSLTADDILLEIEAPFLGEVADPPFDQNVHDAQPAQVVVSSAALFGDDNQDHLIQVQLPDTYPDTDGEQGVIKDGYVILVISSDVGIKAPADTGSYQTGYALMKEPAASDVLGLTLLRIPDTAQ